MTVPNQEATAPDGVAEYRLRFTETHLIEAFKRYRRQHGRAWRWVLKGVILLCLGALLGLFLHARLWVPVAIFAVLLVLLFLGPQLDFWLIKRRFRKSPFYNNDLVVQLSAQGFLSYGSESRTELGWGLFTKARSFPDGFLLFTGPQVFYWLPDSALSVGTKGNVEDPVKTKIARSL